ncbi:MAG: proton-conducting membrane transporter [Clostridia bacterium]|nr:proton-conducting membrane transporter [Clostridia bacterium]
MSYLLSILILLPIISGILIYLIPKRASLWVCIAAQIFQLGVSVYLMSLVKEGAIYFNIGRWIPPVGISLYADTLSMSFVMLSSFLFMMFVIFNSSRHYVDRMFYMLYLSLQGMIAGIFLMDDLFSIFIIVEVSTIVVSLLIMYKRDSRSMYDGLIYLLINVFSMTFYLFGIVVLYKITGTFSLRLNAEIVKQMTDARVLYFPYALIITSVSLKAALMPLFSWLPKAHGTPSAPSVVSAVLSGLYVKGGVYLFFRITNAFSVIDTTQFFFVSGVITAFIGLILALSQTDIKLILSYSTVSQLGIIMLALNLGDSEAVYGGFYHMVSHALFKAALFLCAGIIIEKYETRNINEIRGVFRTMPLVSIACIGAILAVTGAPFFNGATSKYMISHSTNSIFTEALLIFLNFGTVLYFVKFASIFPGKRREGISKVPINREIVLVVLGAFCLAGGIFGTQLIKILYGVDVSIEIGEYFKKSLIYFGTLGASLLLFRLKVLHNKFFDRLRTFDATFNTIALSLPLFFAAVLAYLIIS